MKEQTREIVSSILSDKEVPRLGVGAPEELERIASKALSKPRDSRYQTTKDLLIDLQNLKENLRFDATAGKSSETVVPTKTVTPVQTNTIKHNPVVKLLLVIAIVSVIVATVLYLAGTKSEVAIQSIAVLPLVNENKDPNTEYLSDGISKQSLTAVQLPDLKVMSRNSVFRYKGQLVNAQAVANELDVEAVLTGRLTQHGDNLIISVELIDGTDNSQIWEISTIGVSQIYLRYNRSSPKISRQNCG